VAFPDFDTSSVSVCQRCVQVPAHALLDHGGRSEAPSSDTANLGAAAGAWRLFQGVLAFISLIAFAYGFWWVPRSCFDGQS